MAAHALQPLGHAFRNNRLEHAFIAACCALNPCANHVTQASRPLQELQLPQPLLQLLLLHNLRTPRDVLVLSVVDLIELLDVTHSTAQRIVHDISAQVAPGFLTAGQLLSVTLQQSHHIPTPLSGLNHVLRRGIPAAGITELVGPAGVGKSQMTFGLALQAALPRSLSGAGGSVMLIDTEGKFSAPRLLEMARARHPVELGAWSELEPVLTRVLVMTPPTADDLMKLLDTLEAHVEERGIVLVLLDSVAALLRSELGGGKDAQMKRQEMLGRQAASLKRLAERFKIPVVVTNQVTARFQDGPTHSFQQGASAAGSSTGHNQGGQLSAALGTKWAHCVNLRLVLERMGSRRFIKVAKSPICANHVFEYAITARGVEQLEGTDIPMAIQQSAIEVSIANEMAGDPWL